jgi:hypothetical protein
VLFGVTIFAVVVCCYLAYAVFSDWYYLRFLLPALPELFVAIAALAAALIGRVPIVVRGFVLLALLTVVGLLNVRDAAIQQAFDVRRSEGRAQLAGKYLDASLPSNAVIFAFQESASAWYYTRRPVVRFDLLTVELDTAIHDVRALGRHPVLLVEVYEQRLLAERFPSSTAARLDWRPRAEVPYATDVRVYDPADRGGATPAVTDIISGR